MESETDWLRRFNLTENCSTSDSEDSYDSEEERVKERLYALLEKQRTRQEAADQLDILNEYRNRQKRIFFRHPDLYCAPSDGNIGNKNTDHLSGDDDTRGLVKAHQSAWTLFEQLYKALPEESGRLTYEDVPWIPESVSKMEYLYCLAEIEFPSARDSHSSERDSRVKKAYSKMCLSWHPDKFQNKLYSYFTPSEWDRVMSKVNQTFQELNASWQS